MEVLNVKPKNSLVSDIKPLNSAVLDIKPKIFLVNDSMKLYTMTIAAGQYIGLPFGLTYPKSFTVISPIAP